MSVNTRKLINREISWLAFNGRVLQEAGDPRVPLVQRFRFLGIFSNNQDEFFRVRVATVRRMLNLGRKAREEIGRKPKKLLNEIQAIVLQQQKIFEATYRKLIQELAREHIYIINEKQLTAVQGKFVTEYFHEKVRPAITPVMLHQSPAFPYLKDRSIYLAVKLDQAGKGVQREYALVEIPTGALSRFVQVPADGPKKYIILLDDVIRYCLHDVFSVFGYKYVDAFIFKITRDAELDIDNDVSKSFLEKISRSVKQRRTGEPVRFVYDSSMPRDLFRYLAQSLKIDKHDALIPGGRYHNFLDFMHFPNVGRKGLEYSPAPPLPHPGLDPTKSMLKVFAQRDIMLHYPYHQFGYVIDLLREAAIDPQVTSIKITIYRLARQSNVINALVNAVRNGKKVTVVMELQARFDEEANIYWSNRLQEEGVQVIFGVPGLKVHCKMLLIARKEQGKLVRYANLGTGNYNESTARVYCDDGLFTRDVRITADVNKLFLFLENSYTRHTFKHLIVAPHHMRNKCIRLINREIKNARAGKKAWIDLKMNGLVDADMIAKLYEASCAGVRVRLIIRGICSLVPGIEGQSENIEAISIVDELLEHSRFFVFCNGGNEEYYLSSADWMIRNLDYRVEVTCPVFDKAIRGRLRRIFELQWNDNTKARLHDADQKNTYKDGPGKKYRSQAAIYDMLKQETL